MRVFIYFSSIHPPPIEVILILIANAMARLYQDGGLLLGVDKKLKK